MSCEHSAVLVAVVICRHKVRCYTGESRHKHKLTTCGMSRPSSDVEFGGSFGGPPCVCCGSFSFHVRALVRTRKSWKASLCFVGELLGISNPCRQVQHKTCMNLCGAKT